MRFKKLVVVASLALFAVACGGTTTVTTPPKPSPAPSATPAPTPDPMAATKEYYADNCASCHQDNGEGGPVKIEGKRLNVPPLTKGHALGHSDDEFIKQITNGGDGMPAYKDKLNPDEIINMVKYVRAKFQSGTKAASSDARLDSLTPANPAEKKPEGKL